jgi:beta-catenin-like protein 1
MESEIGLDGEIKRMHQLAAAPEHYDLLVKSEIIPALLSLLTHENTDIAIDSIDLLQELTDEDVIPDDRDDPRVVQQAQQGMQALVSGLVDNQIVELLVSNLERLDEQEQESEDDSRGLFASMGIVENLVGTAPELAEQFCTKTSLLSWLLDRTSSARPFDSVKQYASEILAILLQESSVNRLMLAEDSGRLETVLKSLSVFRKRDPENSDEQEMMENLFDCVCSAVCEPKVREAFVAAEGVELMCLMLK